jgi:hypothetical protein
VKVIWTWPFLSLGLATLLLGALWHAARIDHADGSLQMAAYIAVSIIGAPFILAMRLATATFGSSSLTPLVGLVVGLAPYVLAEWLLHRWRSRRRAAVNSAQRL